MGGMSSTFLSPTNQNKIKNPSRRCLHYVIDLCHLSDNHSGGREKHTAAKWVLALIFTEDGFSIQLGEKKN